MSGGDWYDASCEHLAIPDGMDLENEHRKHAEWYAKYWRDLDNGKKPKYFTFIEWLIKNGARKATEIEEFFDN